MREWVYTYELVRQQLAWSYLDCLSGQVEETKGRDNKSEQKRQYCQDTLLKQQREIKTSSTAAGVRTERIVDIGARLGGHRCHHSLPIDR